MTRRREIIESALLRKKVERVPCFPLVDVAYAATHIKKPVSQVELNPTLHAEALTGCLHGLPTDGIYINLCFDEKQAAKAKFINGCYYVWIDDAVEIRMPENDVASISRTKITSLDDERIDMAQLFHPGMLATFKAMSTEICDDAAVVVGLTGAFSQVAFLYGLESLLMAMIDNPAAVHRAIKKRQKIAIAQASEICGAGARFIWIGDGTASGSLISPLMYRNFVLPYEQEMACEIRHMGALTLLHICGNTSELLGDILTSKVNGYDLDYLVDLKTAIDTLSSNMAVKGNINPLLFLPGNSDELSKACASAKQVAGLTKGFIMSTGCLVPRDTSSESFWIMARACNLT